MLHFIHNYEFLGMAKKNFTDEYGNEMSQLYYIYKCNKCHKIKIRDFMVSRADETEGIPTILGLYRNALDTDTMKVIEIS
ncbi:hypothetical protein H5J22_02870 [Cetobacterium sp. 8H]|uniref:hypothetical protein n=1 Tax=Cetobacterium sp. 8H TaxID=2759681 RepID=UPI00163D0023|nr:hypothetical protein [Cetobacterium sp. 8H]MBC2850386.1 hypothetical protein [Cetobacterium sp. 8H]